MIDTNLMKFPEEKVQKLMSHYKEILSLLGEDPEREGLLKTPERVAKAMLTLTRGYEVDPKEVLRAAKFKEEYSQMVVVKDIDFFSMCEHHMLPFYGKVHVAYIPNGYITGLSKIARVVDIFFTPASSARTHDFTNKGVHTGNTQPIRSNGCGRSQTHVYANERSRKTKLCNYNFRFYRSIQSG